MRLIREAERTLTCPGCRTPAGGSERFCPRCGLPLVLDADAAPPADAAVSERRRRARLIKPQLSEGPLVAVARARNQAEAEFLQSLLLEQGVASMLRRSAGFDVPDMLFAGPRDVLVAASGVETARETLLDAGLSGAGHAGDEASRRPVVRPGPLLVGLLVALLVGAAIIWALSLVIGGRSATRRGEAGQVQAPLRVDRAEPRAEGPLDRRVRIAAVRRGRELERGLLALVLGEQVEHGSAQ
ncbi:MAG TPA: hypothetical protein VKV21_07740 [Solirubrobacteraceae bacterium]|nr:hypothetical protein [Solirubrobacteraceae bacterium]